MPRKPKPRSEGPADAELPPALEPELIHGELVRGDDPPPGPGWEITWRDELNLAEFPVAMLTARPPKGQDTIVFEDTIYFRGQPVKRRLTVIGSKTMGLPTPLDDEVLLGLVQLTKQYNNFAEAFVKFTRGELLQVLNWEDKGQNYTRIEQSLKRWLGVTLIFENAWWDNRSGTFVTHGFHVLDNIELRRRRLRGTVADGPVPCSFRWNALMYQSFQAGSLKSLDFETYLKLKLPTSKRLFRFLDKRLFKIQRLEMDLKTLACEHVGLSRGYAPTDLKAKLRPALAELTRIGFLEDVPEDQRYIPVTKGVWRISLGRPPGYVDAPPASPALPSPSAPAIEPVRPESVPPDAYSPEEAELAELKARWAALDPERRGEIEERVRKRHPKVRLPSMFEALCFGEMEEVEQAEPANASRKPQDAPGTASAPPVAVPVDPARPGRQEGLTEPSGPSRSGKGRKRQSEKG